MPPNALFSYIPTQGWLEQLTILLLTLKKLRRAGGTFRDESEADLGRFGPRVLARRD